MYAKVNKYLARYRIAFISVLGVVSPILFGYWTQTHRLRSLSFFALCMLVMLWAAFVPSRFAKVQLVESILPVIHQVLKLEEGDRVTVHHIKTLLSG